MFFESKMIKVLLYIIAIIPIVLKSFIFTYSAFPDPSQIISVRILIKKITSTAIMSGLTALVPFFSKNVTPM